jgi:hypothetical protein
LSNNSATTIYTVTASGACQCGVYPANFASSTADEDITNVTVGSMNNSSTCATLAGGSGSIQNRYSNYSGIVTGPTQMQGSTVNFSLTQTSCGGAYTNFFQIYVDWNQDGDWLDAGDTLSTSTFTVENADASISLQTNPILSGVAYATVTGGTTGTIYTVRCDIATTAGYEDTRRFRIKVENRFL